MLCPKCKTDSAHRSHRRGAVERLVSVFGYYPYRCAGCKHRFLHFRYSVPPPGTGEHASVEREIKTTRARIQWKRKRRELLLYASGLFLFLCFLYYITRANFNGN
jgi:hypothetical protein